MKWIKVKDDLPDADCVVDIVMLNGKREIDVNYDIKLNEFYKYKDEDWAPGAKTVFLVSYWMPTIPLPK